METIEVLQFIFFFILSVAGILLITFLTFGIFLIIQIRKYLKRVADGVERAASTSEGQLLGAIGGLLKYPIIGFIIKRLFRRFF